MELEVRKGILSGLSVTGTCSTLIQGRYKLQVVRPAEETFIQLAPSIQVLSKDNCSVFPLLLLTLAQKTHHKEAMWLTIYEESV